MTKQSYHVEGMTCAHCVASVTEEVGALAGVTRVAVDLATGDLTVTSDRPLPTAQVETAVTEAGYRLSV